MLRFPFPVSRAPSVHVVASVIVPSQWVQHGVTHLTMFISSSAPATNGNQRAPASLQKTSISALYWAIVCARAIGNVRMADGVARRGSDAARTY